MVRGPLALHPTVAFFQHVAILFAFLTVSLDEHKLFISMKSNSSNLFMVTILKSQEILAGLKDLEDGFLVEIKEFP